MNWIESDKMPPGQNGAGGGGGVVTVIADKQVSQIVAVKILKPEHKLNSDTLRGFMREAENLSALSHPNIVQLVGVSFGNYFIDIDITKFCSCRLIKMFKGSS